MNSTSVRCSCCEKVFTRPRNRYNEAVKMGWKQYCSRQCQIDNKKRRIRLICENCNKEFWRAYSGISKHNYCSCSCAVIRSNQLHPRRPGKIKICAYCGKKFKSRSKYCCRKCKDLGATIPGIVLLKQIKSFATKMGRIPYKNELPHYSAIRARFGTWNNAIKAAGFSPNPVMFANKHVANDGHKCDSLAEKIIDDYLFARCIKHVRNFPYPGNKKFTVDFKVGEYWVEFFGLSGELKRYDELKDEKLKLADKYNLKLVAIYPEDLFSKDRLSKKLTFSK